MADNVVSNPGAGGYTFATDEVDGAHHPYTKMEFGADGEAAPVSEDSPLPVTDAALSAAFEQFAAAMGASGVVLRQDYALNGPVIVTPDTGQQWPVTAQVRGSDGVVRDLSATPKGELYVSAPDHKVYTSIWSGATVSGTVIAGPFDAEGFIHATLNLSVAASPVVLQMLMSDTWQAVPGIFIAGSTGYNYSSGNMYVSANQLMSFSLPPCKRIRVISGGTQTLTNCVITLGLTKTPKTDAVAARLDGAVGDNTALANSFTLQGLPLMVIDATKKNRVLAGDGTVSSKSQGATNQQAGNTPAQPFYGFPVATAITRTETQQYQVNQPIALQANVRGELKVDVDEMRRMREHQLLAAQAAAMQQLDPNWGFELR